MRIPNQACLLLLLSTVMEVCQCLQTYTDYLIPFLESSLAWAEATTKWLGEGLLGNSSPDLRSKIAQDLRVGDSWEGFMKILTLLAWLYIIHNTLRILRVIWEILVALKIFGCLTVVWAARSLEKCYFMSKWAYATARRPVRTCKEIWRELFVGLLGCAAIIVLYVISTIETIFLWILSVLWYITVLSLSWLARAILRFWNNPQLNNFQTWCSRFNYKYVYIMMSVPSDDQPHQGPDEVQVPAPGGDHAGRNIGPPAQAPAQQGQLHNQPVVAGNPPEFLQNVGFRLMPLAVAEGMANRDYALVLYSRAQPNNEAPLAAQFPPGHHPQAAEQVLAAANQGIEGIPAGDVAAEQQVAVVENIPAQPGPQLQQEGEAAGGENVINVRTIRKGRRKGSLNAHPRFEAQVQKSPKRFHTPPPATSIKGSGLPTKSTDLPRHSILGNNRFSTLDLFD